MVTLVRHLSLHGVVGRLRTILRFLGDLSANKGARDALRQLRQEFHREGGALSIVRHGEGNGRSFQFERAITQDLRILWTRKGYRDVRVRTRQHLPMVFKVNLVDVKGGVAHVDFRSQLCGKTKRGLTINRFAINPNRNASIGTVGCSTIAHRHHPSPGVNLRWRYIVNRLCLLGFTRWMPITLQLALCDRKEDDVRARFTIFAQP